MLALQLILLFYRRSKWETSEHTGTRSPEHLPLALLCGFLTGESAPDSKASSPAVETVQEGLLMGTEEEGSRAHIGSESGQSGKTVKGGDMNGTEEGEDRWDDCAEAGGRLQRACATRSPTAWPGPPPRPSARHNCQPVAKIWDCRQCYSSKTGLCRRDQGT